MALSFFGAGSSADVFHRYLKGPQVDQLFVDEQVSHGSYLGNFWALADQLGTVRDMVDDNGVSQAHLLYNAYGGINNASGPHIPTGDFLAFTGREWDKESGRYYYRARYYDPATGDFISQDSLGLGPDTNPYRYVANGPTDGTDPSGNLLVVQNGAQENWQQALLGMGLDTTAMELPSWGSGGQTRLASPPTTPRRCASF